MADTTYVDGVTLLTADSMNDLNRLHYTIFGDPASLAAVRNTLHPLVAEQASTSGTSIDFTGIPSGVKRITVMFIGVSTNGISLPIVQIGDSGGIETSGYLGSAVSLSNAGAVIASNLTTGLGITGAVIATSVIHGKLVLDLQDSSQFTWVSNAAVGHSDIAVYGMGSGSKSLSAELDRVRVTTGNGTDAFDAGAISISYE